MSESPSDRVKAPVEQTPAGPSRPPAPDAGLVAADPRWGAAREQEVALVAAVAALPGLPTADTAYSVRRLTVSWLIDSDSSNTRRSYYADLARWLDWCASQRRRRDTAPPGTHRGGTVPISDDGSELGRPRRGLDPLAARPADVVLYRNSLTGAPATISRRLAACRSWYRYLQVNQIEINNPFDAVKSPKRDRQSPTVGLTLTDAALLCAHAGERADRLGTEAAVRDALLLYLLIDTGMRVGGVLGADLTDLAHQDGHQVLWYRNKGGARRRTAIPPHSTRQLDRYLVLRAAREGVPVTELTGPLLTSTPYRGRGGGKRLVQRDAWNVLRRTARDAGLPTADNLSPHSARRGHNTIAKQQGATLEDRQAQLGHEDPRTTQYYDDDLHNLDRSPTYLVAAALTRQQGT